MKNHHSFNDSVILGVDTHLDIHVGAVLSYDGKLLGTKVIQTNQVGYEELFEWVLTFGSVERAGIEGTGTYGAGLTRFLIKKGSMFFKSIVLIVLNVALKENLIHLMRKMPPERSFPGVPKPFPNCNPVPARRYGSSALPVGAP